MQSTLRSYTHLSVMQISLGFGYVFASGRNTLFAVDIIFGISWLELAQWHYNVVEDFTTLESK